MNIFASYAFNFYEQGYSIIPVLSNKAPAIKDWTKFCETRPSIELIESWVNEYPNNNIGLCLGPASGVVAFDYDYEGPDEQIISNIIKGILPPSPVNKQGKKGYTNFYKYSGQSNISVNRGKNRVFDFLSTGRQTVLPPSIHPSGIKYSWGTDITLENVTPAELPDLPEDIIIQLKNLLSSETEELFEDKIIAMIPRHDMCVGFIFRAMVNYSTPEEIVDAVLKYDKDNFLKGLYGGKPAYFEDPKYVGGKTSHKFASDLVNRVIKWCQNKNAKNGLTFTLGKKNVVTTCSTGFHFVVEKVNKKTGEVVRTLKPDYYGFSKWCKDTVKAITLDNGDIAFYQDGKYSIKNNIELQNFIVEKSNFTVKPQEINNFLTILKSVCYQPVKATPEGFINLKNGILDVFTGTLHPHNPDYHFFYKLNIEYDPNAKCPIWDNFLNQIFQGDEELIKLIHQIFGYIIEGGYPYLHKAFVFYGDGRNGKSTVLNVLEKLVSKELVSYVNLDLLNNPFACYQLANAKVNINEELSTNDLNSAEFKNLVSGGTLRYSKKFKDEMVTPITARFVFATNTFPVFKDTSFGIDRRLCIIPFEYTVPEELIDVELNTKLSQELPGILNRALAEIPNLRVTRKLISPKKVEQAKIDYKEDSDSVFNWLSEQCEPDQFGRVTMKLAYHRFCEWCRNDGRQIISKRVFVKRIISASKNHPNFVGFEIQKERDKLNWYLKGLSIKKDMDTYF